MKFSTQHMRVAQGHNVFTLHREGKTTWKASGNDQGEVGVTEVTVHATVRAAKAVMGSISSASK